MNGLYNVNPPIPKYGHTWEVHKVLAYLKTLGNNEDMHIRDLSLKLTTLIALTTACRASEIQNLDPKCMMDKGETLTFQLQRPTKVSKNGKPLPQISLHQYKEEVLDPVACCKTYIQRTGEWRSNKTQQLLLGTVKPHKPIAVPTVSSWLKETLHKAGIDTTKFKAHSTRSACTSTANKAGMSIHEIMQQANWSHANTFHKHYHKDTLGSSAEFSATVLDA